MGCTPVFRVKLLAACMQEAWETAWLLLVASAEVGPELSVFAGPATLPTSLSSPLAQLATAGIWEDFLHI